MTLEMLAILSGVLQALGYWLYIRLSLKQEIQPNPSTWFMFAYGVALLTVLEISRNASWQMLVLPIVCALLSVFVAFICWKRGTLKWPRTFEDRVAFLADVGLTIGYVGAWILVASHVATETERNYANMVFLVCSNLTTFTSFAPLVREAKQSPQHEHSLPWSVWAVAYALLGAVTLMQKGVWTDLMIYPAVNSLLHARVAWLARPARKRGSRKQTVLL